LDIAIRDDFSAAEVSDKTYRLNSIGVMIHGLLLEDRKYSLMQAAVDAKIGQ
jgi:hypothetical protein